MKLAIILPTYNNSEDTLTCLESIQKHTNAYHLIWVDDASSETHFSPVEAFLEENGVNYHCVRNSENMGFVQSVNAGLNYFLSTDNEAVIVQNNDTIVYSDWSEKLLRVLASHPSCGAVGPLTNYGYQSLPFLSCRYAHNPALPKSAELPQTDEDIDIYLKRSYAEQTLQVFDRLAFFSTLFPRNVIEEVGLLDERYGKGYYDDDDYCERILRTGKDLYIALDTFVTHHTEKTFGQSQDSSQWAEERQQIYQNNKALFEEKFGYASADSLAPFAHNARLLRVAGERYLAKTLLLQQELTTMEKSSFWKLRDTYIRMKKWITRN